MLSSILQQTGNVPELVTSISYLPEHGNPTTETCISLFKREGLKIVDLPVNQGEESNRAIARNLRAKNSKADWILFADADMVYSQNFFEELQKQLETDQWKNEKRVIGADRHSLDIQHCVDYFNRDSRVYPCVIPNVASEVSKWPVWYIKGKHIAAGYFQLASLQAIKEKGGIYSKINIDKWRLCRTDRVFRSHMGGRVGIDLPPQYHLNHDREGPEKQR
jgi:glycosyltransferase involved in cell wall biosynthesis